MALDDDAAFEDTPVASSSKGSGSKRKKAKSNGTGTPKRKPQTKACLFCRRSHMTCDDERPCSRCIKRSIGHLCTDEEPKAKGKGRESSDSAIVPKQEEFDASPLAVPPFSGPETSMPYIQLPAYAPTSFSPGFEPSFAPAPTVPSPSLLAGAMNSTNRAWL